jgi:EmrB/QacA subfamily drug resistance transporter
VGHDSARRSLLWPTLIVLGGAVMNSLSFSAVNVALPELTLIFNTTPATIAWVTIGQMLATATLLTVFGRLSDMTGRKRLYLTGLAISIVASTLCGLSANVLQLVAFRILHGIGTAMVLANSLAYLIDVYPPQRRGFLVGAWEACIAIGLAIGPTLGGLLLSAFGWQSIFYIYVAIASVLLPLSAVIMVEMKRPRAGQTFDIAGALFFAGALAPLMYALTIGQRTGWTAPITLACLGISLACIAAFIFTERRVREPMVHLELFRSRGFSAGNLSKVCAYFGFSASTFLLPFYWARVLELPPATMGLTLTAFPAGMLTGSLISGPLSDRIGTRLLAPAGLMLLVIACLLQTGVTAELGVWPVMAAAALAGFGAGAFIAPNDSAILAITPKSQLGVANGIMGVSRTLGALLGQSLAAGLLTARLVAREGDFVTSYHDVFAIVALVTFLGVGLSATRDRVSAPLSEAATERAV